MNKILMVLTAGFTLAFSVPGMTAESSGYESPVPPPELGEQLASYRTDNQKKGSVPVAGTRGKTASAGKSEVNSAGKSQKPMSEVVTDYAFVPNKNVPVYTGGETIISFVDRVTGEPVKVSGVEVSNRGFTATSEKSSVIITPTGHNTNAKIRIVLENRGKYPLIFELSYMRSKHNIRNIENVRI